MEWQIKKLGEVCEIYQPQTITSSDITTQGPFKVFGANGVIGYYSKYNHEDAEVLVTCRGATCGTLNMSEPKSWVTGNAMVVHPKDGKILLKSFLYYALGHSNLSRTITGTGQPQITRNSLAPFQILLPPLQIQKQIVERLDKIAEAQKLNDGLIQKTDELFQSLLHKELDPAGKNWEVKKLKEVCEINPSKAGINKLSENTGVSFLAMADVSVSAEITNRQEKKISEVKNGFTFFEDGDVLVAKITPCFENGKGALVENMKNGIGFGSTEFHVLRANQELLINKLLYYLVSDKKFRKIGAKFMTGSAGQRRVPKQYLENHKISLPPFEIQKQIVAKLSAVQDYKKQLIAKRTKLKELFDSVLHKSMKNE